MGVQRGQQLARAGGNLRDCQLKGSFIDFRWRIKAGQLADELQRRCFDWLDQPIQRVTGGEGSPSISKVLERAACARTEEVIEGLQQVIREKGAHQ